MAYIPTEAEAVDLLQGAESEPEGPRRNEMIGLLSAYRENRKASGLPDFSPPDAFAARKRQDTADSFFDGLDTVEAKLPLGEQEGFKSTLSASTDPEETKAAVVNQGWVLSRRPDLAARIDADWPTVRQQIAQEITGSDKPFITDKELYAGISGHLKQQKAAQESANEMLGAVQEAAFDDLEGAGWLEAYRKSATKLDAIEGLKPEQRDAYRNQARLVYEHARQRTEALRPLADNLLTTLSSETDARKGFENAQGFSREELLPQIYALDDADRHLLYRMIATSSKTAPETDAAREKGAGQKLGEKFGRQVRDLATDQIESFEQTALAARTGYVRRFKAGETPYAVTGQDGSVELLPKSEIPGVSEGTREETLAKLGIKPATEKQISEYQSRVSSDEKAYRVALELKDIAEGVVDPAKFDNRFIDALANAPGMAAYSAQAALPGVGIALLVNGTKAMRTRELMARGLPIEEATNIATASALVEAPIEWVQSKMLFGRIPGMGAALSQPLTQTTLSALGKQAAKVFAAEYALQNIQEAAQDATPLLMQEMVSHWDAAIPKTTKDDWMEFGNSRIDTAITLLPLALVGTATASFKDQAYGRAYLENKELLKAAGFRESAIEQIDAAQGIDAKESVIQELWDDPEMRQVGTTAQKEAISSLDKQTTEGVSEIPSQNVERTADGGFVVRDAEGQPVDSVSTPEAAAALAKDVVARDAEIQAENIPPVEYAGFQEGLPAEGDSPEIPGMDLYNLTEDIEGHPKGSTVSRQTLEQAGFDVSRLPTEKTANKVGGIIAGSAAEFWADRIIKESRGRAFSGIDPELFAAYVVKGAAVAERGVRDFAKWSKQMLNQFGENVRPHLEDIYDSIGVYEEAHKKYAAKDAPRVFAQIYGDAPVDEKTGKRRIVQRVTEGEGASEMFSPEVRAKLQNADYRVMGLGDIQERIKERMKEGADKARADFENPTSEISLQERVGLGLALAEQYNAEKRYDDAAAVVDRVAELGTQLGQSINVFKLLGMMLDTPEKAQAYLARQKRKITKKLKEGQGVTQAAEEISNVAEQPNRAKQTLDRLRKQMERLTGLLNEGTTSDIAQEMATRSREVSEDIQNLQTMIAGAKKALRGELRNKLDEHQVALRDLRYKIQKNTDLLNEGTTEEINAFLSSGRKVLAPEDIRDLRRILADTKRALKSQVSPVTDYDAKAREKEDKQADDLATRIEESVRLLNEGTTTEIAESFAKRKTAEAPARIEELRKILADAQSALRKELKNELTADQKKINRLKAQISDATRLINEGTQQEIAEAVGPRAVGYVSEQVKELQGVLSDAKKLLRGELKSKLDEHTTKLNELRNKIEQNVRLLNEGTKEQIAERLAKKPRIIEAADVQAMKDVLRDSRKALESEIKAPKEFADYEANLIKRLKERNIETTQQMRDALKRVIELQESGKLSIPKIEDIILSKYDIPAMDEADQKKLADLARRVARLPSGSVFRADAVLDLMNFVNDHLQGLSAGDKAWAIWYANILSGYNTHIRNVSGNAFELLSTGFLDTATANPVEWFAKVRNAIYGGAKGFGEGIKEGVQHAKTGESVIGRAEADKFSSGSVLERHKFAGGKFNPANYLKYVGRTLAAEDAVAFHTAFEMKSLQIAWKQAESEGLEGGAFQKRVAELLNQTDEQQMTSKDRAEAEWKNLEPGDTKLDHDTFIRRRILELTQQERNGELVERATNFANRVTFNYKPEGLLGVLAEGIGALSRGLSQEQVAGRGKAGQAVRGLSSALRLLVPFTRIAANVLNRQLDYAIGIPRSMLPSTFILEGGRPVLQEKTADDRAIELRKGVVGLIGGTAIAAALWPSDDPDEERKQKIKLHGSGPGNYNAQQQLRALGWQPWSVQIGDKYYSFRYLPIGLLLASIGELHDQARYKERSDKTNMERAAFSASAAGMYALDASFLSSVSDFLGALTEKDDKARVDALTRFMDRSLSLKAAVPFSNLWQNVTTELDDYDRDPRAQVGVKAWLAKQVPVAQMQGKPAINILGEPIENKALESFIGRAKTEGESREIFEMLAEKEAWPSGPNYYRSKMDSEMFYAFQQARGRVLKGLLAENLKDLQLMEDEAAKVVVGRFAQAAAKVARGEVGFNPNAEQEGETK